MSDRDRMMAAVERVRRAAAVSMEAHGELAAALISLPQPAGASDIEHVAFRDSVHAYLRDIRTLVDLVGGDVARHVAKGSS